MTTPLTEDERLEQILATYGNSVYQNEAEFNKDSPLAENFLDEAKAAIKQLLVEARIDELKLIQLLRETEASVSAALVLRIGELTASLHKQGEKPV